MLVSSRGQITKRDIKEKKQKTFLFQKDHAPNMIDTSNKSTTPLQSKSANKQRCPVGPAGHTPHTSSSKTTSTIDTFPSPLKSVDLGAAQTFRS